MCCYPYSLSQNPGLPPPDVCPTCPFSQRSCILSHWPLSWPPPWPSCLHSCSLQTISRSATRGMFLKFTSDPASPLLALAPYCPRGRRAPSALAWHSVLFTASLPELLICVPFQCWPLHPSCHPRPTFTVLLDPLTRSMLPGLRENSASQTFLPPGPALFSPLGHLLRPPPWSSSLHTFPPTCSQQEECVSIPDHPFPLPHTFPDKTPDSLPRGPLMST